MKKLVLLLAVCMLGLSLPAWQSSAQVSSSCLTFSVPVVVHGTDGPGGIGPQRVVAGQSLQFTVTSASAPGASVFNENGSNLGTGAVPGLAT